MRSLAITVPAASLVTRIVPPAAELTPSPLHAPRIGTESVAPPLAPAPAPPSEPPLEPPAGPPLKRSHPARIVSVTVSTTYRASRRFSVVVNRNGIIACSLYHSGEFCQAMSAGAARISGAYPLERAVNMRPVLVLTRGSRYNRGVPNAGVAELVDAADSKSAASNGVGVRVSPPASSQVYRGDSNVA